MYGGMPYAGGPYAGTLMSAADIPSDGDIHTAIEVAFTTASLSASPAFVDVGGDCRWWDTIRGRSGELERFQPGRATVVLDNRSRQYDSVNAAGPWSGYLKPNKRIRIRETVNGVTYTQFDGFVDRWQLDYPDTGKDATATVTATDGFKIFARTDLPKSVYALEVATDAPAYWWRLGENLARLRDGFALNAGSVGTAGDGTFIGAPQVGGQALVVNDDTTSMGNSSAAVDPEYPVTGVNIPSGSLNLLTLINARSAWTFEAWCQPIGTPGFLNGYLLHYSAGASQFRLGWFSNPGTNTGSFQLSTAGAVGGGNITLLSGANTAPPGGIYHVVLTAAASGANLLFTLYVNGASVGTVLFSDTFTATPIATAALGHSLDSDENFPGQMQDAAVYLADLGAARVAAHYAAGTAPWRGDDGDDRLNRICDLVGWPSAWRYFDDGDVTLQSAELDKPALEEVQKVGETEFPQVWVTRDGKLRFMNKTTLFARSPLVTFGDASGEIGYRSLTPDEGDGAIRNYVVVSRLDGVAKTATDSDSITDYGRMEFVLEGLLHDSDAYSQTYANIVRDEYAEPGRRITSLELGPPVVGTEATAWPAQLGLELQDAVTVKNTPMGGGDRFERTCQIDGVRHTSRPGEERTTSLTLSPEYVS